MKRPVIAKFFSALLNIAACSIAVTIILFRQNWFGSGDTYAFIFWTIPLAVGLAVSGGTIIQLIRTNNFLLRLLVIIAASALISFLWIYFVFLILGPWINAFSFPIFYLWVSGNFVQLLYLNRYLPRPVEKTKLSKLLLRLFWFPVILVGVVISIFFISFLTPHFTGPEKETYLIPDNFQGKFMVIYGEKCGINPRKEKGRRILEIPGNGVLIIQPKFVAGTIDHEYYFVDKAGKRTKIKQMLDYPDQKNKLPGVLVGGAGGFGGAMPNGGSSSESPLAINFTDFTVFNKDMPQIDERDAAELSNKLDSLTRALVDECRKTGNDKK